MAKSGEQGSKAVTVQAVKGTERVWLHSSLVWEQLPPYTPGPFHRSTSFRVSWGNSQSTCSYSLLRSFPQDFL